MNDEKYIVRSGDTVVGALREEGHENSSSNHKYLELSSSPVKGANTRASFIIIEQLLGKEKSRKKWYKDKNLYTIDWPDQNNKPQKSKPFNYLEIAKSLREAGKYDPKYFNLPAFMCDWLDSSVDISINFHRFDEGSKVALTMLDGTPEKQYGKDYPIKPRLDREGHFFTTFQPQLIRRIIKSRTNLVLESHNALHYDWILDLRTLINDSISLLEITLNQIYIKAKYDLPEGWEFNIEKLGDKHGRRLTDKLKWIRQLSGKNLDIENEMNSLNQLRELRNHFNHFDPPSLVVTLEESVNWLNQIIDLGYILIKIRETLGLQISNDLINFILQKEVQFIPQPSFSKRLKLNSKLSGYESSTWKEK